jgi:hypothetical protein
MSGQSLGTRCPQANRPRGRSGAPCRSPLTAEAWALGRPKTKIQSQSSDLWVQSNSGDPKRSRPVQPEDRTTVRQSSAFVSLVGGPALQADPTSDRWTLGTRWLKLNWCLKPPQRGLACRGGVSPCSSSCLDAPAKLQARRARGGDPDGASHRGVSRRWALSRYLGARIWGRAACGRSGAGPSRVRLESAHRSAREQDFRPAPRDAWTRREAEGSSRLRFGDRLAPAALPCAEDGAPPTSRRSEHLPRGTHVLACGCAAFRPDVGGRGNIHLFEDNWPWVLDASRSPREKRKAGPRRSRAQHQAGRPERLPN